MPGWSTQVRDDPRGQCLVPRGADQHRSARPGAAVDERGRRVRPLRARLRPGRRADAVRHVPPLYRRRAFDPRDRPAGHDRARRAGRGPSAVDRLVPPDRDRAGCSMSRCCCTTSPRGGGGDHSVLGEQVALELCPRFGLDPAETETVAWLVRHHLLMSATAFKRDLADPKTIEDFVAPGAKPRAAAAAADADRGRHPRGRAGDVERVEAAIAAHPVRRRRGAAAAGPQAARAERAGRSAAGRAGRRAGLDARRRRGPMPGGCPTATGSPSPRRGSWPMRRQIATAEARIGELAPSVVAAEEPGSGATRISVFAPDRPGLFYRICGGAGRGRRVDRRCPHPHHPRRHGARQSAGPGQPAAAPMPTASCAAGWSRRSSARWSPSDLPAAAAKPAADRAAGPPSRSRRR